MPPLSSTTALGFLRVYWGHGPQTPFIAGSQMNLCNCRPSRTGKPSARIHSVSSRAFNPGHVPAGSGNTGENKHLVDALAQAGAAP